MSFNNSPLLAMPPLASTPNSLHRHRESGDAGNHGSNTTQDSSINTAPNFQIPFQPTPVQHGPTPLTFGFGFGSSIGSPSGSLSTPTAGPSTTPQWGQSSFSHMSPSHRNSPSSRGASAISGKRNETKRRRDSEDDDDSDDDMEGGREKSASPMSYNLVIASKQALPKRMRAGIGAVGMINLDDSRASYHRGASALIDNNAHNSASTSASAATDKMDLGKILSTLDKPSLLTLFSRLITTSTDPTLRDQIIAHIPSPSLESVESALDEIERNIRNACAHSGQMRAEFAWGRLRNPVSDFVTTSLGFLPFFIDDTKNGGVLSFRQETPHLSTTFNFLHALTVQTLRIVDILAPTPSTLSASLFSFDNTKAFPFGTEANPSVKAYQDLMPTDVFSSANPNTIVIQLIPSLLMQWSRLQERLCKGVNEEGKMFGSEMMRNWIMSLESLGWAKGSNESRNVKEEERAFRTVLDGIRARLEQGVGWLIGLHPRSGGNNNTPTWRSSLTSSHIHRGGRLSQMEEEEEL